MEKVQFTGRVTGKKLIEWINKEFERFDIEDYRVFEINRTSVSSSQIEGGAARLIIMFKDVRAREFHAHSSYFLCFYTMKQLQSYLKDGYELCLTIPNRKIYTLTNLELEVRKS